MEQREDKGIGCQTSSDSGNISTTESQSPNVFSNESLPKSPNYNMYQYGAAEELDFEDEKGCGSNSPKIPDTPHVAEKLCSDDEERTSSVEEAACSLTGGRMAGTTPGRAEVRARDSDEMEEGEATDDDDDDVDVEDGEIKGKSKPDYTRRHACRFYQRGRCRWGNQCHYRHLSNRGLYNMFDSPALTRFIYPPARFAIQSSFCQIPQPIPSRLDIIWDRALIEAKARIQQSKKKREECFEDSLYMTVGYDEVFADKWEHPRDRYVLPAPLPKRPMGDFSSRCEHDRHPKLKEEPKLVRKSYGSKSDREWRDPWRRSQTPPHRKRSPSKPLSDSSKSSRSRGNSHSSWSSRSCRSPSPTEHARIQSLRKRSPSRMPKRSTSSWSCSDSDSSSSSNSIRWQRKDRKTSPRRHVCRKRKASPIILPYKRRRSRSMSRSRKSVVHERPRCFIKNCRACKSRSRSPVIPFSKRGSVARQRDLPKVDRTYRSRSLSKVKPTAPDRGLSKVTRGQRLRSLSSSSKSSGKLEPSDADSCDESCSDMSISPPSVSPIDRKPKDSGQAFRAECRPQAPERRPGESHPNRLRAPANPGRAAPQRKVSKRVSALEMELLKYGGGFRPSFHRTQPSPSFENSKGTVSVNSSSESKTCDGGKLSKRDLLIQQLRVLDEAIAKKREFHAERA